MLTGEMKKHPEPATYSSTQHWSESNEYWSGFGQSSSLGRLYDELSQAVAAARKDGFVYGVKVRRKTGATEQIGTIEGYEYTTKDGFSAMGICQPVVVKWPSGSKYSYSTDDLILIKDVK